MKHFNIETFDYDTFKTAYDQDQILQSLVKDFNETGIELVTKKSGDKVEAEPTAEPEGDSVYDTAIKATRRHQSK